MAFYVRKIARAKWSLIDKSNDNIIENYRADAIANDMRTYDDTLSFWKANSLSNEDLEPIIVINSLLGDNIKKIDLLCIPEELIEGFSLQQMDGDTVVNEYKGLHYNIISLSIKKLVEFAGEVVLKAILLSDDHPEYIQRIPEQLQLKLVNNWIEKGKINFNDLKDSQKNNISKYRGK